MRERQREDEIRNARPQYANQCNRNDKGRHSEKKIQERRHNSVRRSPQKSRKHPHCYSKNCGNRNDEQGDRKADLPAIQDAREYIAPKLIRSEEMRRRIARQTHRQILLIGIAGRNIGRKYGKQHPRNEQYTDDGKIPSAQQSAPQVCHS